MKEVQISSDNQKHEFILDDEFFENFTSIHTRKNYLLDINQFLDWVAFYFKLSDYKSIERLHVIKYRNYLSECGGQNGDPCTPKTINRKLASLSTYFKYLVERNYCQNNPISNVKRPRPEVKTATNAITREQVREIFNEIKNNKNSGILHMALLVTLFTTGLRKSEILNLRFKDYKKIGENFFLEYTAKGGKLGKKLLTPICTAALDEYITWMKSIERTHADSDWLFQPTKNPSDPTNLNKPLNPKTINEIIASYSKKVGLGLRLSAHSARATFISELLRAGVDIYVVAREVGHASVQTTQEYDKRRKKLLDSPVNVIDWEES